MSERLKKIFYIITDWVLNLSIVITIVLMGFVVWLIIDTSIINPNSWIKVSQPYEPGQPNPEMMKILDELEKKDGKN